MGGGQAAFRATVSAGRSGPGRSRAKIWSRFLRDEVFAFYTEVAARGAVNFMDGARLVIDEPVVLTQVIGKVDGLRLDEPMPTPRATCSNMC
jgi:hypothetical protein